MESMRRNILIALGSVLMSGVVVWLIGVSLASWSWPVRVFPPLGMFALGALCVAWAWRGGHDPKHAMLDKAIADGHALLSIEDHHNFVMQWACHWRPETYEMLRREFGLATAMDFADAIDRLLRESGNRQKPRAWVTAQVEYLEGLRRERSLTARVRRNRQ
jgi:hypothetical protein